VLNANLTHTIQVVFFVQLHQELLADGSAVTTATSILQADVLLAALRDFMDKLYL
jgi:hypothetical protein